MATMGRAVLGFIDRLPYTGDIDTLGTTTSGHNKEVAALINHTLPLTVSVVFNLLSTGRIC